MKVKIHPADELRGNVNAISSKNYTTRYLLAAALAEGTSEVYYPARSEDSGALRRCLADFGASLAEDGEKVVVTGFGRNPKSADSLDVGNAGAVLRFLMSVAALSPGAHFVNTYPDSLGKRPHGDLIDALEQLGIIVRHHQGRLPLSIEGGPPQGGIVRLSGKVSSQYLSSLLFMTPLLDDDSEIRIVDELKSKKAIEQTLQVLEQSGIQIAAQDDLLGYHVPGKQSYKAGRYDVQGDYPGSSALMAAAAVTRSDVRIHRLEENSKQGEKASVDVLKAMGVNLTHQDGMVHIRGNGQFGGGEFDGDEFTDAVLALTAAAVFAQGVTRFYNVENLRYKECDRISDFLAELKKAGAKVEETQSEIIVYGRPEGVEGGVEIDSHIDHRVIMALSVVGLRAREGLVIRDAQHVAKSYPGFFEDLMSLGANVEFIS